MVKVSFSETRNRAEGVSKSLRALEINPVKGKNVLIKPNFNTADPVPGSTHNDTLIALVDVLRDMGALNISVGERSYPPTLGVMREKGVIPLLEEKDVRIINFDDLDEKDWVPFHPEGSHWPRGFYVARPILEAECLVSTCCLKTHQYGGVFTLSLKLHVGVVPTSRNGFPCMNDLHSSPHQQKMIAELNQPFSPDLVLLDGVDTFVDGGPMTGRRAEGNAMLASTDRVAIDAAGVAMLKVLGSNEAILGKKIFAQDQISRAVELGLGVSSADEIDLFAADPDSGAYCDRVREVLAEG